MKILKNLATIIISIIIVLLIIEIILRISGNKPRDMGKTNNKEPVIYIKDLNLGWIQKPGKYVFQPWSDEGEITTFTVSKNGSRKNFYKSKSNKKIIFIGGSLTQGWAVDDKDNFISIFQSINPNYKMLNFAAGGYGGYQSLLMLEKIINNEKQIRKIIYGFIEHHEIRNVAAGSWMYLLNKTSSRGHILVPYASLNNDKKLKKNPPIKYIKIPFSNYSSLLAKIEKRIMKLKSFNREKNKYLISKEIILKMNENAKKIGASFTLLFLDIDKEKLSSYKDFLDKENIDFVICPFPEGHHVKGEGHPNKNGHKSVAYCINNNFND